MPVRFLGPRTHTVGDFRLARLVGDLRLTGGFFGDAFVGDDLGIFFFFYLKEKKKTGEKKQKEMSCCRHPCASLPDGERRKCYSDLGLDLVRAEALPDRLDLNKSYCRISDTHVVIQPECDGDACGVVQKCSYN